MPPTSSPSIIRPLLLRFERRRPIRAGSLIITLYGDAIAPRGGSLWLGSLNHLLEPLGIEAGLVRTALSRLVAEGWFERNRAGKNSYYRLSTRGAGEFTDAGRQIYAGAAARWGGKLELEVLTNPDPKQRQAQREVLAARGYGQLAPHVMVRPAPADNAARASATGTGDMLRLSAVATAPDGARKLAATCWALGKLNLAYQALVDDLAGLAGAARALERLDDEYAFQVRLLLIHEWRRIVLRDPLLPSELLPVDWPGCEAREAVRRIYRAVTPGCERWIDATAVNERGQLPRNDKAFGRRFAVPD